MRDHSFGAGGKGSPEIGTDLQRGNPTRETTPANPGAKRPAGVSGEARWPRLVSSGRRSGTVSPQPARLLHEWPKPCTPSNRNERTGLDRTCVLWALYQPPDVEHSGQ